MTVVVHVLPYLRMHMLCFECIVSVKCTFMSTYDVHRCVSVCVRVFKLLHANR